MPLAMEQPSGSAVRASSGSSIERAARDRRQNPQQQVSQIEKSVTQLLVATKQLLETLTQWSRGTATEAQVSDIYVRLGYEFNIACRAFGAIGVETSDLGPVPDLLRSILEETLSQEASQASLDRFLPRIRDIIINLLQGLKKKQQKLRQKNGKDGQISNGLGRQDSATSLPAETLESTTYRQTARSSTQRQDSTDRSAQDAAATKKPRTQSGITRRDSPGRQDASAWFDRENRAAGFASRNIQESQQSLSDSSTSSREVLNVPSVTYSEQPADQGAPQIAPTTYNSDLAPPRPRQQDALAALQSGGDLERRASRRFSAYQIHKHLGAPTSGIPMIPSAQTPPIPNRGRDTRESMNAVRVRGSGRSRLGLTSDSSPSRLGKFSQTISEESTPPVPLEKSSDPTSTGDEARPKPEQLQRNLNDDAPHLSATLSSPVHTSPIYQFSEGPSPVEPDSHQRDGVVLVDPPASKEPPTSQPQAPTAEAPANPKELTLFLQYKSKIKKFLLPGGYDELSVGRLQLAFIDKFAWNTHSNGAELPEIYIQDPVSGVRHELEDLADVKNHSVLVLNIDALDEVKRHVDDGLVGLRRVVEGVKSAVDDQQSALQRVSDRQQETVKEVARLAAIPSPTRSLDPLPNGPVSISSNRAAATKLGEVQALRRDLAVIRQTCAGFFSEMESSMSTIRTKAAAVKTVAVKAAVPSFDGDSGRAYVNSGKKTLSEDSEKIVNRVDDLQDVVEDLRKDVVTRGVRPLPRQLEDVSKDISTATAQLKKLQEYLKREKPLWTKIWENELQVVCDDRDLLTMQEELAADLEDDLEKAAQTFALVEQATKQQNLQSGQGNNSRSASRNMNNIDPSMDPQKAKDGVLGEVRALQPNHETRLEAIDRAEKARQRELENRKEGEFGKELGNFVEEGRLKKSGGVEEAERLRRAKDERIRKEVWDRQNPTAPAAESTAEDTETPDADATPAAKDENEPDTQPEAQEPEATNERTDSPEPDFVEASEEAATTDVPEPT